MRKRTPLKIATTIGFRTFQNVHFQDIPHTFLQYIHALFTMLSLQIYKKFKNTKSDKHLIKKLLPL